MTMQVIVGRFATYQAAKDVIAKIGDSGVKLEDYAVVTNNGDGNFTFEEGKDAGGGKGFAYGAVLTAGVGLLLGPIGWGAVAAGGVAGGLVAKLHDANIPSERLEEIGRELQVGQGAAIAVTTEADRDFVFGMFGRSGGTVEAVGVTEELKDSLENLAPTGVTVSREGDVSAD